MNDVFISYRRENGKHSASLIKRLLEERGARCYLDRHKKKTKDFKEALLRNIDQSINFLLILSKDIFEEREDDVDWVRDEIDYANKQGKNIVAVMFDGYDPSKVDWDSDDRIKFLKTFECLPFDDSNPNLEKASVDSIIEYMDDENGKPWVKSSFDNNGWYDESSITDEDRIWMYTSMEVCKRMDAKAFNLIMKNDIFANRSFLNFFSLMAYDIDTLAKRTVNYNGSEKSAKEVRVFGFCHECDIEHANEVFGPNHFIAFSDKIPLEKRIKELLELNHLINFDIVDMTLILKDYDHPEQILRVVTRFLNPDGSAIYIRDLDDDLVIAHPDETGLVAKALELLKLDRGAGNRDFGRKIYNFLCKSGADEIVMTDADVTTANFKVNMQRKLCDAYFSYLLPEFRHLVKTEPTNEYYIDGLNWLEQNYSKLESLFESKEFYFRSGYISGFGIYKDDEFFED